MLLMLLVTPAFTAMFSWADRKRQLAMERFAASGRTQIDLSRRQWKRICVQSSA
jgi:hypothetical protein